MAEQFKFIDLFSGIGGFHLAMHGLGGKCVFASEIDLHARKTYEYNFKNISPQLFNNKQDETINLFKLFNDDIRSISPAEIPDFDILCAGFPCQPFSQAGHKRGFDDNHKSERGNLFFNIVDIIKEKKPKAFFLENVRGIMNHDNGNTFKTIREILEVELGYSFYFKVVKACDYGLPQLRPRAFMIGFRDEGILRNFVFPPEIPLKFNMSDVFQKECSREIGFTIRVGGRGSPIDDRRNWDAYLVAGEVVKLMPPQALKMQGFPDNFEFPVSSKEAMKQLGNTVAVDAVRECAKAMIEYMNNLNSNINNIDSFENNHKNKGEWTELLTFLKILHEKKLILAHSDLTPSDGFFNVSKVSTLNIANYFSIQGDEAFVGLKNDLLDSINDKTTIQTSHVKISDILNDEVLQNLTIKIKGNSGTFHIDEFDNIQKKLGLSIIKGGNSFQKADIVLDISNDAFQKKNEGFGIKSYLGSKPTLLNASGNTNFIFKITGISVEKNDTIINSINSIDSSQKIKDRLNKIRELGGHLVFSKVEVTSMEYNLKLIDSYMPQIVAAMLLEFYCNRTASISKNLNNIDAAGILKSAIQYDDFKTLEVKVKRLLVSVLLGFFPGEKWSGHYVSNGTIVVKNNGEQVAFHIIDLASLETYLFQNIKFDTPSSTRHRFGQVILENDGGLYFKLNLQLRF